MHDAINISKISELKQNVTMNNIKQRTMFQYFQLYVWRNTLRSDD